MRLCLMPGSSHTPSTRAHEGARARLLHGLGSDDYACRLYDDDEDGENPRQHGEHPLRTIGTASRFRCVGTVCALSRITHITTIYLKRHSYKSVETTKTNFQCHCIPWERIAASTHRADLVLPPPRALGCDDIWTTPMALMAEFRKH